MSKCKSSAPLPLAALLKLPLPSDSALVSVLWRLSPFGPLMLRESSDCLAGAPGDRPVKVMIVVDG